MRIDLLLIARKIAARIAHAARRTFWRHHWVYPSNGNPYRRTCSICGQHQELNTLYWGDPVSKGWWEVLDEGEKELHYTARTNKP